MMAFWNQWASVLTNPVNGFRKAMYRPSFSSALFHMMFPAVAMAAVIYYMSLAEYFDPYLGLPVDSHPAVFGLAAGIFIIATWLLWSALVFVLSKIVKGRGTFLTQTYLIALYTAPLGIVNALSRLIVFGFLVELIASIYSIYLLFVAVQVVHGFDNRKSATIVVLALLLAFFVVMTINTFYNVFVVS